MKLRFTITLIAGVLLCANQIAAMEEVDGKIDAGSSLPLSKAQQKHSDNSESAKPEKNEVKIAKAKFKFTDLDMKNLRIAISETIDKNQQEEVARKIGILKLKGSWEISILLKKLRKLDSSMVLAVCTLMPDKIMQNLTRQQFEEVLREYENITVEKIKLSTWVLGKILPNGANSVQLLNAIDDLRLFKEQGLTTNLSPVSENAVVNLAKKVGKHLKSKHGLFRLTVKFFNLPGDKLEPVAECLEKILQYASSYEHKYSTTDIEPLIIKLSELDDKAIVNYTEVITTANLIGESSNILELLNTLTKVSPENLGKMIECFNKTTDKWLKFSCNNKEIKQFVKTLEDVVKCDEYKQFLNDIDQIKTNTGKAATLPSQSIGKKNLINLIHAVAQITTRSKKNSQLFKININSPKRSVDYSYSTKKLTQMLAHFEYSSDELDFIVNQTKHAFLDKMPPNYLNLLAVVITTLYGNTIICGDAEWSKEKIEKVVNNWVILNQSEKFITNYEDAETFEFLEDHLEENIYKLYEYDKKKLENFEEVYSYFKNVKNHVVFFYFSDLQLDKMLLVLKELNASPTTEHIYPIYYFISELCRFDSEKIQIMLPLAKQIILNSSQNNTAIRNLNFLPNFFTPLEILEPKLNKILVNEVLKSLNKDKKGESIFPEQQIVSFYREIFSSFIAAMCWVPESIWGKCIEKMNIYFAEVAKKSAINSWKQEIKTNKNFIFKTLIEDSENIKVAIHTHLSSLLDRYDEKQSTKNNLERVFDICDFVFCYMKTLELKEEDHLVQKALRMYITISNRKKDPVNSTKIIKPTVINRLGDINYDQLEVPTQKVSGHTVKLVPSMLLKISKSNTRVPITLKDLQKRAGDKVNKNTLNDLVEEAKALSNKDATQVTGESVTSLIMDSFNNNYLRTTFSQIWTYPNDIPVVAAKFYVILSQIMKNSNINKEEEEEEDSTPEYMAAFLNMLASMKKCSYGKRTIIDDAYNNFVDISQQLEKKFTMPEVESFIYHTVQKAAYKIVENDAWMRIVTGSEDKKLAHSRCYILNVIGNAMSLSRDLVFDLSSQEISTFLTNHTKQKLFQLFVYGFQVKGLVRELRIQANKVLETTDDQTFYNQLADFAKSHSLDLHGVFTVDSNGANLTDNGALLLLNALGVIKIL